MTTVKGGRPNFGQVIGIIMADTVRPRIPGDPGNASTYDFPVRYVTVRGSTWERFVEDQAEGLLEPFVQAAQELEREGVKAITTSCGLLTPFQEPLANSVGVPMFASCLLQVPLLLRMLNEDLKVCIITLVSSRLSEDDLKAAGVDETSRVIVVGTEHTEYLFDSTRQKEFDPARQREDIVRVALEAVKGHPDIGAFVLECSSFPPYGPAIHRATGLPVFDLYTMVNWVASGVNRPKDFEGYM
jgi:hypothetical protein